MVMKFVDREEELKAIKERLNSNKFELIVIYGRRRIGKTRLVLEAVKGREYIYYLATEENNLRKFKETVSKRIKEFKYLKEDWEAYFEFLKNKIIIIDEFPNLIKENKKILSEFQRIVDTILSNTKTKLIILGSSISMIESKVLSFESPLYGRKTSVLKLKPLKFKYLKEFFPKASIKELIEIYGFADGIPYYLEKVEYPFWQWLEKEIKKPDTFLKYEVDFLLKYEFEDIRTYKKILEAIALGKNTPHEIKDYIGIRGEISKYLKNLMEIELIERVVPVTESGKSKKSRYFIKDNFITFWFRYIYPNLSLIEEGIFDTNLIKEDYNNYLGFVFEKVCREALIEFIKKNKLFVPYKIGKWWYKDIEIDWILLGKEKIAFAECKWRENIDAKKVLNEIKKKVRYFPNIDKYKEIYYLIFAKSFKEKIEEKNIICIDLKDLEKLFFLQNFNDICRQ